jgi:cystinosin
VISFVKYAPAAYWNYKRKSTKGWSIFNILLDLVGGVFSIASGALSVSNGLNITKMVLAIVTIVYDLIFVFQHYVLYRKRKVERSEGMGEEEPLGGKVNQEEKS